MRLDAPTHDGRIARAADSHFRKSLGLDGGTKERRVGWMLHGGRWALFMLPLAWLGVMETRGAAPEMERTRAVAEAMPEYALAQFNLGVVLADSGDREAARAQYERALELDPEMADARYNLGNLLLAEGAPAFEGPLVEDPLAEGMDRGDRRPIEAREGLADAAPRGLVDRPGLRG